MKDLNNIGVSANDIRGVIVNEVQALSLISLFGIVVKQERDKKIVVNCLATILFYLIK